MEKSTFLFEELDEEDSFKVHTSIAEVLKKKIVKLKDEDKNVNIGLLGKWGTGKSFIVNKLEKASDNESIKILKFDGWKFNGKSLERSILSEYIRENDNELKIKCDEIILKIENLQNNKDIQLNT